MASKRGEVQRVAKAKIAKSKQARPSTKSRKPAQPVFGGSSQAARARGVFPRGHSK